METLATKDHALDLLIFRDDKRDDHPAVGGGLDLGFDVGEFLQAVNPLVILFDGGRVKLAAFARADQVEDDGGGNGLVPKHAHAFNNSPGQRRDRAADDGRCGCGGGRRCNGGGRRGGRGRRLCLRVAAQRRRSTAAIEQKQSVGSPSADEEALIHFHSLPAVQVSFPTPAHPLAPWVAESVSVARWMSKEAGAYGRRFATGIGATGRSPTFNGTDSPTLKSRRERYSGAPLAPVGSAYTST